MCIARSHGRAKSKLRLRNQQFIVINACKNTFTHSHSYSVAAASTTTTATVTNTTTTTATATAVHCFSLAVNCPT